MTIRQSIDTAHQVTIRQSIDTAHQASIPQSVNTARQVTIIQSTDPAGPSHTAIFKATTLLVQTVSIVFARAAKRFSSSSQDSVRIQESGLPHLNEGAQRVDDAEKKVAGTRG